MKTATIGRRAGSQRLLSTALWALSTFGTLGTSGALVTFGTLATPSVAHAQFGIGGALYNQPMDYMYYNAQSDLYRRTFDSHNKAFGKGRSSSSRSKSSAPALNPKAYQYKFSPAVSQQTAAAFETAMLENARKNNALDPETEKRIRAMQTWDFVETVRQGFKAKGANPDSIATALSFWLTVHYGTINKVDGSEIDTAALQKQLERVMSQDKTLLAASDADKQRMAENLLWLSLVQIVIQEEAGNDPAKLSTVADRARENLRAYGIDPQQVKLDKDGLKLH